MPVTVGHNLSATTPDDNNYEIRPSHWNSNHDVTLNISASEISGLFSNANGVSWGLSGSSITASVATNYQSQGNYLTTAALSNHSHGNPQLNLTNLSGTTASNSAGFTLSLSAGNYITTAMASNRGSDFVQASAAFAGTNASGTIASNGISVSVGNYLTTARASNDAVGLNTALTANGVAWTVNSSGISLNVPAFLTTAALSNHSHGNPQLNLTNLSGTTASNSGGFTLSLSAAAPGAGGGIAAAAGTQTATSGTVVFSNSNGITFGMSGSTQITASHNGLTTARASNDAVGLNTAQTNVTWTVNSAGLSLNAGGYAGTATGFTGANISGSMTHNSAGLSLSLSVAAAGPGGGVNRSFFEIMDGERMTTCALWNNATFSNRIIFNPFWMDGNDLQMNTVRLLASRTGGTSLSGMLGVGFYSMVNSTQLSLFHSATQTISVTTSAQFSGVRIYDVTGLSASSLSEGRWVMGILATMPGTASWGLNLMGGDGVALAGFVNAGANQTAATASNSHIVPFWGVYSATSAGFPATVGRTQISGGQMNANSPDVYAAILEV